jgi:hypothetical protein
VPAASCKTDGEDEGFLQQFESGLCGLQDFGHATHIRLGYIYLTRHPLPDALVKTRHALLNFLNKHGISESKYSETLTLAWLMAIRHFMQQSNGTRSAAEFLANQPQLLNTAIMLTHYSRERLFSEAGRKHFLAPDLAPIPDYPGQVY